MQTTIILETPAGRCRASVFHRDDDAPAPAVLFFMDGIGYRPALFEMGERLAQRGYVLLLPDMFYRGGSYEPEELAALARDARPVWREKYYEPAITTEGLRADVTAFLAYLATRADVAGQKLGVVGYCMGGGLALRAAGMFPDRFAAVASFHGGGLATDAPDSPHLAARTIAARVYAAGASEDPSFPDDMKARFTAALADAGVRHVVETYEGARHGFAVRHHPNHHPDAAERHWRALLSLFETTLKTRE